MTMLKTTVDIVGDNADDMIQNLTKYMTNYK